MSDKYLWDRSGERDIEVARLEQLLGQLRLSKTRTPARVFQKRYPRVWWAVAAAVLATAGVVTTLVLRTGSSKPETSWRLSVGGQTASVVRAGQTIETTAANEATLESQFVGRVNIAPESRLRVLPAPGEAQRFALDRGTIHALIWAPPTRFAVDTRWAKAIDLGCQYTLRVDDHGAGFLTVETGWVAFEWRGEESFIPAGAACATRPRSGPGTPYFLDAPATLTTALARFDKTGTAQSLDSVLSAARPRDALTLWHLLRRTEGEQRTAVLNRFEALVPLPSTVHRAALLRGDQEALDAAWNALGLGNTSWWREWKRQWWARE